MTDFFNALAARSLPGSFRKRAKQTYMITQHTLPDPTWRHSIISYQTPKQPQGDNTDADFHLNQLPLPNLTYRIQKLQGFSHSIFLLHEVQNQGEKNAGTSCWLFESQYMPGTRRDACIQCHFPLPPDHTHKIHTSRDRIEPPKGRCDWLLTAERVIAS